MVIKNILSTCLVFFYKFPLTIVCINDRKIKKNVFFNNKNIGYGLVGYFYIWTRFNCDYKFDYKIDYICGLIHSNTLKSDIIRFIFNMCTSEYNYI